MPQCPHCDATYIAGEPFCSACGQTLPAPTLWPPRAFEPPPQSPAEQQDEQNSQPAPVPKAAPGRSRSLRLQLPSGIIIDLQGRKEALLGRKDGGVKPDVDLLPYGAVEKGVSRQHALIVLDDGRYYIKDLKSTNYTLLNAARLFPEQLYPLKHDDQLTLGDLEIRVLL